MTTEMAPALAANLTTRIIDNPHEWDAWEAPWNSLFDASPTAAPPLHFTWLRHWWRCYDPPHPAGTHRLAIILLHQGATLVGALPLYLTSRRLPLPTPHRLAFLSTGEPEFEETCPDYLNLLCLPGYETLCLSALQTLLPTLPCHYLELAYVPASSLLAAAPSWWPGPVDTGIEEPCFLADLTGGFDAYLRRPNAHHRNNIRRYLKAAATAGATLQLATPDSAPEFFAELVDLHQKHWTALGKPGCFSAPRFTHFHRTLALQWIPTGQALLARLRCAGQTQAVIYGFLCHSHFHAYQTGITPPAPRSPSPALSAHLLLMQHLAAQGVARYDLLRGASQYKDTITTQQVPLTTLRLWRPTLAAKLLRTHRRLRQTLHRAAHL